MHEYITRLKQLNEDIAAAWQASDRINALKLSIQAAKLLRDSSVPTFFPVLFVLVCDILDTIGRLVFERIRAKAERTTTTSSSRNCPRIHVRRRPRGGEGDVPELVSKIASVQELVPASTWSWPSFDVTTSCRRALR